jgi:hypothetical protein
VGSIFKVPAFIIYFLGGIWGLFIVLGIVYDSFGFWGTLISFLIFPFVLYGAPLYVGIVDGNWFPAIVCYGSGITAMVLYSIGMLIDKD